MHYSCWSNPVIPKQAMLTCLLFAVAVVAFAGLAYEEVPVGTTQALTQQSTETGLSYSRYFVANTNGLFYTYTHSSFGSVSRYCAPDNTYFCVTYLGAGSWTYWTETLGSEAATTRQETATVPYSQTTTSSITETSTKLVPNLVHASEALGLTGGEFSALAIVVIGIFTLLTAWVVLKPRIAHGPRQATLSQFVKTQSSCIKCGAELPPASKFCNKCGTEQT